MKRLLVVYDITIEGDWQFIVRDQITKLIFSGLFQKLSFIHCRVVGASPNAAAEAAEYLSQFGSKFSITGMSAASTTSQSIAHHKDITADDWVLYLSTYGTADTGDAEAAFLWRSFMEYKVVKEHEACLQHLGQADIVGVHVCPRPPSKFSLMHTAC